MRRKEALVWLSKMKHVVCDDGYKMLADEVEDVETKLYYFPADKLVSLCRKYAKLIIEPGKMGHVRLVLAPPYRARVLAMIVGILKSVEGD